MAPADASWGVEIRDVAAMGRLRAIQVLASTGLTWFEAMTFVTESSGTYTSGPLTREQAERSAAAARKHGAEARVGRLSSADEPNSP
ncbi:hypothetical protein [Cellulomonas edaphi]|uniref:Uncharacterized protein n=1 Tax=Cellulomonas edaphi TaxID=3053468 RepID=A0ABT7S4C6_9CELL|nr:hypothetical protein [Cellulomons edaphi]MDM7830478.1 hypothetical protein [Cellulomons edaphi]